MLVIFLNSSSMEYHISGSLYINLYHLFPFVVASLAILHWSLYYFEGFNNPLGIDPRVQTISFYPYFYVKELCSFFFLVFFLSLLVVYYPNIISHPANYIPSNFIVTPAAIVPHWYFLPFYAILRSIPDKLGGVLAMFSAIIALMILPFLNTSEVRSGSYRLRYAISY